MFSRDTIGPAERLVGPGAGHVAAPRLPGHVLQALIGQLARTGRFMGACEALPGWVSQGMPDGLQVARCRRHMAGAVMTDHHAVAMFLTPDAGRLARGQAGVVLYHALGTRPDWRPVADGLHAAMPIAPGWVLEVRCTMAPVDPLFTGRTLPGVQMAIGLARTG